MTIIYDPRDNKRRGCELPSITHRYEAVGTISQCNTCEKYYILKEAQGPVGGHSSYSNSWYYMGWLSRFIHRKKICNVSIRN